MCVMISGPKITCFFLLFIYFLIMTTKWFGGEKLGLCLRTTSAVIQCLSTLFSEKIWIWVSADGPELQSSIDPGVLLDFFLFTHDMLRLLLRSSTCPRAVLDLDQVYSDIRIIRGNKLRFALSDPNMSSLNIP